ncbi:DUF2334 domain-containing protein [Halobiforma nitratireducens]|uniref:Polysaccharide deacetylase n=1 Tax=Halobiforma nitratireducens JCM 10879 TaxID=1227454 RepID=M0LZL8_9EURY|nr:DUF2334 domain-containing protein [Halobiforma nitratireducens]EMA37824.1 polysaccharide deacetylase [Halobiforma nitratireducens JCM 10879]
MSDVQNGRCEQCQSQSVVEDRVLEHECGHIAPSESFEDGCPKCRRTPTAETVRAVGTTTHCLDCGHRSTPATDIPVSRSELPSVTFPTLPSEDDHWNWVPERFLPRSDAVRQLLTSLLVLTVLVAGVAGAVSVTPLLDDEPDQVAVDREWEEYDSIVVFRNDDIQPWYLHDELRAVNDVFIEAEIPVTLAIIPMVEGDAPITDDERTCEYLRSLEADHPGQFEMALHGYTHEPITEFSGGSEFGGLPVDEQRERLVAGQELLADCVDSPSSTFVPPMNTYDDRTVEVLAEANYTTVSGGSWFTADYYDEASPFDDENESLRHVPENLAVENWTAYDRDGADDDDDDDDDVPLEDLETLTHSFDESHADNDVLVVMFHYQYFTSDDDLEMLESLIEHMKSEGGVAFMTVEQFALGLEEGEIEETDDGWRVLEPIAAVVDGTVPAAVAEASVPVAADGASLPAADDLVATVQRWVGG